MPVEIGNDVADRRAGQRLQAQAGRERVVAGLHQVASGLEQAPNGIQHVGRGLVAGSDVALRIFQHHARGQQRLAQRLHLAAAGLHGLEIAPHVEFQLSPFAVEQGFQAQLVGDGLLDPGLHATAAEDRDRQLHAGGVQAAFLVQRADGFVARVTGAGHEVQPRQVRRAGAQHLLPAAVDLCLPGSQVGVAGVGQVQPGLDMTGLEGLVLRLCRQGAQGQGGFAGDAQDATPRLLALVQRLDHLHPRQRQAGRGGCDISARAFAGLEAPPGALGLGLQRVDLGALQAQLVFGKQGLQPGGAQPVQQFLAPADEEQPRGFDLRPGRLVALPRFQIEQRRAQLQLGAGGAVVQGLGKFLAQVVGRLAFASHARVRHRRAHRRQQARARLRQGLLARGQFVTGGAVLGVVA